jgi:hypothetical protein
MPRYRTVNRVWTGDITYIHTGEGWLYLAIVLDLFKQEIVGWSIKPRMTADLVTDALTMAWFRRKPGAGVLFHGDRGSQYAGHAMTAKLAEYGMTASMSRKGNCCSSTWRCSTTGVVATPPWATARRCSSCRTGSAGMLLSNPWRHRNAPLEDEIRRAPHP